MKKAFKIFLMLVLFLFSTFAIIGCVDIKEKEKEKDPQVTEPSKEPEEEIKEIVQIKSLSGENIVEEQKENLQRLKLKRKRISSEKSSWNFPWDSIYVENELVGNTHQTGNQYVIMFKNETDIKFTITLDNPKGEAIDAVELTCDDPNSKILVDGIWENIRYDNGKIILNWAQENPYKKVFKIRTTSEDAINTIKVNDLKVNGSWQGETLNNDELKIYKIDESEIKIVTVHNRLDYYDFKVETSENIKIKEISSDKSQTVLTAEGNYRITKSGKIYIKYTYNVNGVELEWDFTREIQLLKLSIYRDDDIDARANLINTVFDGGFVFDATGTDIDANTVYFTIKGILLVGKRSPEYKNGIMLYFYQGYTGMQLIRDEINENEDIILFKFINGDKYSVRIENNEIVFRFKEQ